MEMIKNNLPENCSLYERSIQENQGTHYALVKHTEGERFLCVLGEPPAGLTEGTSVESCLLYPLTPVNARVLQRIFPWLRPRLIEAG